MSHVIKACTTFSAPTFEPLSPSAQKVQSWLSSNHHYEKVLFIANNLAFCFTFFKLYQKNESPIKCCQARPEEYLSC